MERVLLIFNFWLSNAVQACKQIGSRQDNDPNRTAGCLRDTSVV